MMTWLPEAIGRCKELHRDDLVSWVEVIQGWSGASAIWHSIAHSENEDVLLDHAAALRYALVFRALGFSVGFEPTGSEGPDLAIRRDGISATVEVTRFRYINPGPAPVSDAELLRPYGNPPRDIAKAMRKLARKFRQATHERALIAVWNDDESLEELEVELAVGELKKAHDLPDGLMAVVHASRWVGAGARQFYWFWIQVPQPPAREWCRDLEATTANGAISRALAEV